jgi:phospholipid/cholesterol/gamma-HCH transport system substrate-binding protein
MKNTLETRLGLFFAFILIAAVIIMEMIGGPDFFKRGMHLRAQFTTVQDLKAGDPVKLAGVPVGRVEFINLVGGKAEVTMKVHRDAGVRNNSKASIRFLGLMGQNYVFLEFSTNGLPATEGTLLPSVEQPDVSSLMAKLDSVATGIEGLTKSFNGDTLSTLMGPFTDFFKDNKDRFGNIISNVQTVSTEIAQGKGTVGKLIHEDTLYNSALGVVTNLNDTAADFRNVVDQAKNVIGQVNQGQGTIGKLVKDEALYKETAEAMANLREIFQKVNRGQGSVGKLINDESLFNNAKLTLQKLDKATEGLEDQGPLSVIGVVAGNLF